MTASAVPFRRISLGDVGSTNDEARTRLDMLAGGPYVVTGVRQLSGRGRRGRNWVSPAGNVYASFALTPEAPLSRYPELSFVAALAVSDAALGFVHEAVRVRCKWPNDVLIDGAKVSGILLETAQADRHTAVIVGIGVNVASRPADTPYAATAVTEHAPDATSEQVFAALAEALAARIGRWEREGFAAIRQAWLERADGLGEPVVARLSDREVHGRFVDLAPDGALMLENDLGDMVRIAAGDVFRPRTES